MKKRRGRMYQRSALQCPECKFVQHIYRPTSELRESGHIKDLWCHRCREVTKHVEQRREWMFEPHVQQFLEGVHVHV